MLPISAANTVKMGFKIWRFFSRDSIPFFRRDCLNYDIELRENTKYESSVKKSLV